ncbi:MAG TPA: methyltransferase domain-containing protein [Actinophytocola sp.]|uniref:class I SAM-dependent methyltransferase n=1 Tax=Actinophytocola sp. TaxID=1872138 RepID=UPI002E087C68|nr:methyltransferase domain-containing protein [Actinophytocola sp.]
MAGQLGVDEKHQDGGGELARITTGDRVLDLASGVGDPAIAAAHRVGPTGRVIATDLAPDMVAFAAQRAAAAGLANVETHEMDAAAIDLPEAGVDAVLCRLGLMFVPDLDRVLAGVRTVLVPGGRFATAIPWRPTDQAMPRLVGAILAALDLPPLPPVAPGVAGIFSLADASYVCAALERAGLTEILVQPFTLAYDYHSPDEWLDFLLALNVPLRQHLAGVSDAALRDARHVAIAATTPWLRDDGHIRFTGHGYYATAVRPVG